MAKKSAKSQGPEDLKLMRDLRRFIRTRGTAYLRDPNVTSIGIGRKNGNGEISVVFTVREKLGVSALESLGSKALPERIDTNGRSVPTDVVQRSFKPAYSIVERGPESVLKSRLDPLVPGASVSHPDGTAGTLGAIVFDAASGAACILSNWHILHGETGQIGDKIVQPGPFDDNNTEGNTCGTLLRSHLGVAGDCALARIAERDFERTVYGLDTVLTQMADVDLGDTVVKTGRTTETTYGIVRRTDVIVQIDFGDAVGAQNVGCFEIGPNPDLPAADGEISMGGDSGAVWIISEEEKATDIFAGLHFAEEGDASPDEHALACYPASVQSKLGFTLVPPNAQSSKDHAVPQDDTLGYPCPQRSSPRARTDAGEDRYDPTQRTKASRPVEANLFRDRSEPSSLLREFLNSRFDLFLQQRHQFGITPLILIRNVKRDDAIVCRSLLEFLPDPIPVMRLHRKYQLCLCDQLLGERPRRICSRASR